MPTEIRRIRKDLAAFPVVQVFQSRRRSLQKQPENTSEDLEASMRPFENPQMSSQIACSRFSTVVGLLSERFLDQSFVNDSFILQNNGSITFLNYPLEKKNGLIRTQTATTVDPSRFSKKA